MIYNLLEEIIGLIKLANKKSKFYIFNLKGQD